MEIIFVSTDWLVFISIFNNFVQTWNKDDDDDDDDDDHNNK